ncbi:hypothetical protein [Bacillus sp. B-jedd]|uniref:hypothetical protein n=1 Tax=Bacillus sp. B-jedd TaxID=1476857 RepID=UPI00051565D9|nr:hypothetical protein [Bacillus sp. B-jedd]CEG02210.1 hypothetical protein BN1002_04787 [Bacillus sp. B-jedd]CEG25984.1 hypothetical protein BN1002_00822 [Bacillus sp. B-jedd]CEG29586.1 hypothetical protein BN1002_04544 [Bacillus sp. B-jedd]
MDKKALKEVEITDVIKHVLRTTQDYSGEYSTSCNIDFLISQPIKLSVFDKDYLIDRIKMIDFYGDEIVFSFANDKERFCCFPVPKTLIHKIYIRIIQEQKTGVMQGWRFEDTLIEILRGESIATSCY